MKKSLEELQKDIDWKRMADAITEYWQSCAYGTNNEFNVYSEHKEEILQDFIEEMSQTIFDATDGWVRFPEDSAKITDMSEEE